MNILEQYVAFEEVEYKFDTLWAGNDNRETLCSRIFWDCLTQKGLTAYADEKTLAIIHIYPYVINMLCAEFYCLMFDLSYSYEFDIDCDDDEVLTEAAIGWLYRDSMQIYCNVGETFTRSANEMISTLAAEYRYTVADAIFDTLGSETVLFLLYYTVVILYEDKAGETAITFDCAEDFLDYCKKQLETDDDWDIFENDYIREMSVWHWLMNNSSAIDD